VREHEFSFASYFRKFDEKDIDLKVYGIYPLQDVIEASSDPLATEAVCVDIVTDIIVESLHHDGYQFCYCVDWRNPGDNDSEGYFDTRIAKPHIIHFGSDKELRDAIYKYVHPRIAGGNIIRSIATCRAVTTGWDGQAFICLRHEDPVPKSPNETLVVVQQFKDFLANYDLFDGWVKDQDDE
jgi:hypothetical protein